MAGQLPPGPGFGSMFFKFIQLIVQKKNALLYMTSAEVKERYGGIVCFRTPAPVVVITDTELIQEVYINQGDKSSLRLFGDPESDGHPVFILSHGKGLLESNGRWQPLRNLFLSVLKDPGVGMRLMEEAVLAECELFIQVLKETATEPTDVIPHVTRAVINVTTKVKFGTRLDYADKHLAALNFQNYMMAYKLARFLPFLKCFPGDPVGLKKARREAEVGVEFVRQQVAKHKETLDKENPRDLVDRYLIEMDKDRSADSVYTDENLLSMALAHYIGGTNALSETISWSFFYLLQHPEAQQRIYEEIQEVIGDREIKYSDKDKMPYTSSFLTEVLRITTITIASVPVFASEDIHVKDYVIPQGTRVFANLRLNGRDANQFRDPETFKADRFLDASGKYVKADSLHFIPFGVGQRSCPGNRLAVMELFIYLVDALRNFHLESGQDKPLSEVAKDRNVTYPPKRYLIKFVPRK